MATEIKSHDPAASEVTGGSTHPDASEGSAVKSHKEGQEHDRVGNMKEQRQHAEMMKQMPDMVHEDANTLTLEPGETKNLIWQFTKAGKLEVACHIPGHYEAGMVSKVIVNKKK